MVLGEVLKAAALHFSRQRSAPGLGKHLTVEFSGAVCNGYLGARRRCVLDMYVLSREAQT